MAIHKDDVSSSNNGSSQEKAHVTRGEFADSSSGNLEAVPELEHVDSSIERAIIRKLDWHIVPMVMWIYLNNMVDRVNIGNARLFEMEADLNLGPNQFQMAVSLLFVTYCLFEAPSNMIIKKMQPAYYITGLVFCWGLVATFSSFVESFGALIACRLLLGFFEAGFFPGVVLYMSMFYGRRSLALRIAYFYSTAAIAGAVGGLIAYGIGHMHGVGGWNAWRWIICLCGIPTIITAFFIPFVLPNSPETARFLTEEDRANLVKIQHVQLGRARNLRHMEKPDVIDAIKDWTTWAYCFALFPLLMMLYSFVVFLPTIINNMGEWDRTTVQAMTVPVYAFGACFYITCAYFSDRTQLRGYFIMGSIIASMIGYAMLLANAGTAVSYTGCFFVVIGIFTGAGISFAWVPTNNPRYGKRAFSTGMHLTIGNSSGVASPFLFSASQSPTFRPGYSASLGLLAFSLTLNIILHLHFKRQNKLRDQGKMDHLMEGKSDIEIEAMGEKSPRFRFAI